MKTRSLLVTAIVGAGLVITANAWSAEQPGETVDMNSVPAAVQKTIKEKAAGGEVVSVKREDDKNGKWNYEAVIKKNGKESELEVDPKGNFVREHHTNG